MTGQTEKTPDFNIVIHSVSKDTQPRFIDPTSEEVTHIDSTPVKLDEDFVYWRSRYLSKELGDHLVLHQVEFPEDIQDRRGARVAKFFYQKEILPLVSDKNWASALLNGPFGGGQDKPLDVIELFFAAHDGELSLSAENLVPFNRLLDMLKSQKHVFEEKCLLTGLIQLEITNRSIAFVHKVTPRVV